MWNNSIYRISFYPPYNLPEFIQEKVQVDTHAVMETMRNTKGIHVK